jgi:hypothetical protein
MECASCGALIDRGDRFCPACCLPNIGGIHHPRFGPPEREPGPLFVDRVVGPGLRGCPRCGDGIRASDHYCRSCGIEVASLAPLPPEGRTVGVWTGPGAHGRDWYHPMAVLTAGLRLVLAAVSVVSVAVVANSLLVDHELGGWVPLLGNRGPNPNWSELQTWGGNLAALQLALIGVATLLVMVWSRRAYRNLPALNVIDTRFSPRWAVLGWIIPGVNVVVPKQILDDTWRASDPAVPPFASGSSGWRRSVAPTTHHLWWICTLVALPLVVLTELQLSLGGTLPPATASGIRDAQWGYLLLAGSQALLVFSALLLSRIVGSIYERQRDRADAIGPAAPTATSPGWRGGSDAAADAAEEAESAQDGAEPEPVFVHALNSEAIGRY